MEIEHLKNIRDQITALDKNQQHEIFKIVKKKIFYKIFQTLVLIDLFKDIEVLFSNFHFLLKNLIFR